MFYVLLKISTHPCLKNTFSLIPPLKIATQVQLSDNCDTVHIHKQKAYATYFKRPTS